MRRRLLAALTGFAALAVLAFAVPLTLTVATNRTQQLVLARSGDADRFALLSGDAVGSGDPRALADEVARYSDLYSEGVLVVDARGAVVVEAGIERSDPAIGDAVAAARRNQRPAVTQRLMPWSAPAMLVARPVGTGVQVDGAVVIEASTERARTDIARAWAVITAGAVVAMAVFTALALVLSRWVLRPLGELSDGVAALTATLPAPRHGQGAPASIARRYGGPPEVRELTESFDAMAAAVADSAEAQRQLVADTAHAMRNPLAALTIRLDSLETSIPDRAAATFRGAAAEVDRLTSLLDGLLALAVAESASGFAPADPASTVTERCDPASVAHERVDAWHQAFARAGVELTLVEPGPSHEAAVSPDVLAQILDVPLSNACRYAGAGAHTRITVSTEPGWTRIEIADDGVGVSAPEVDRLDTRFFRGTSAAGGPAGGSGLGLPIARALARANRGTMTIARVSPHGLAVTVRLPATDPGRAGNASGDGSAS
ncbi:signal transduction histidine kinase [Rhodococcus sp. OK611]|uniref:sensor histidine kinase n=1 Tax=Rhodococcus TaxID=1827 RepID=UPI000BCFBC32|nr:MULTISPECIES: HAMP domain-containing sensor histidine kinase [Rhodococcus]MCZ4555465.1 HAMP domain-containing sensor histidine kinase [Rhodococcus maanshanensis]PTR44148.1 signal transduction histidine kinase [Rhodococcus sp. OK611]SNX90450.1 Signal transduction histidine kinase [Rhodococcus sp. OK270]